MNLKIYVIILINKAFDYVYEVKQIKNIIDFSNINGG